MPDSLCVIPWTSVHTRPDGFMSPCCHFRDFYRDADGAPLHLSRSTLLEGFRSAMADELRRNLMAGIRDERCQACWNEEARGQKSKRQHEFHDFAVEAEAIRSGRYHPGQPIYIDLSLGKVCNLKCRICNANVSSAWEREAVDLGLPLRDLPPGVSRQDAANWIRSNPAFWAQLESWLPEIREFNFVGGEPFLSREHFALLYKSVELGTAARQSLRYNTNGTIFPAKEFTELYPNFRQVQIWVSADDLGERFEYQRFGAKWDQVAANIDRFQAQSSASLRFAICLTVSPLNIFYLLDSLEFWLARGVKVFLSTAYGRGLGLACLPASAKAELLRRFAAVSLAKYDPILLSRIEPFLAELNAAGDAQEWQELMASLRLHDTYREQSYAATFPEAARFYGLA